MLEGLDAIDFSRLEDAYGPAVDVPARLRAIAAGQDVAQAIYELGAGIFHQGSYYSASPIATRFLVEIARQPSPARVQVLAFLSQLAGGEAEPPLGWDPYAFHATPGPPDYPEARS